MGRQVKKHIAFITLGGIGTGEFSQGIPALNDFVEEMKKEYRVTVFSLWPINKGFVAQGFTLLAPSIRLPTLLLFLWLIKAFLLLYFRSQVHLIHCFWGYPAGFFGCILKKLFRIPLLIHLQGGDATYLPEIRYGVFAPGIKSRSIRWAYRQADKLVALTQYQKNALKRFYKGPCTVIPFGVDTSLFFPQYLSYSPPYRLIHIAHLNPVKNQRCLLEAFQKIALQKEATLWVIGLDALNGEIQHYASKLGLDGKVEFKGMLPHSGVLDCLQKSHILLHTSFYEAQALSVAEALACGVAVCGSAVGLLADLDGYCTLASPVNDSENLAANVLKLLNDEILYRSMIQKGLSWSKENDLDCTIRRFREIYGRLMK